MSSVSAKKAATILAKMHGLNSSLIIDRQELSGELSFEKARKAIQGILNYYQAIPVDALDSIPDGVLDKFAPIAEGDFGLLEEVIQFDTGKNNKFDRDKLIDKLNKTHADNFYFLLQMIAYTLADASVQQHLEGIARQETDKAIAKFDELSSDVNNLRISADKVKQDLESRIDAVVKVAEDTGVSKQATFFRDEAQKYDKSAEDWKLGTFLLAVLLAGYSIVMLSQSDVLFSKPNSMLELVHLGLSKILVFAVFSFAVYFSARNYFTAKHLSVINRHRHNALRTYRAIVAAAKDVESTNAILVLAASCMFQPQPTGLTGHKGDSIPQLGSLPAMLLKHTTSD